MNKCPQCGFESNAKFCSKCGTQLEKKEDIQLEKNNKIVNEKAKFKCPKCGHESNELRCPECGTEMTVKTGRKGCLIAFFVVLGAIIVLFIAIALTPTTGEKVAKELNTKPEYSELAKMGTFRYNFELSDGIDNVIDYDSSDKEIDVMDGEIYIDELEAGLEIDKLYIEKTGNTPSDYSAKIQLWNTIAESLKLASKQYSSEKKQNIRIVIYTTDKDGKRIERLACQNGVIEVNAYS